MKVFTRYTDQYVDINGHNWIGVHAINPENNQIMLHTGCDCGTTQVDVVECGTLMGPDEFGVTMRFDLGEDDVGKPYCTMTFTGELTEAMRRMEEKEGQRLQ